MHAIRDSPGRLQHERAPARTRLRPHVLHAQASVRPVDIRFDRRRNAREHETTAVSDTSHEYWRQLDERGGQQIGHDQRPGTADPDGASPSPPLLACAWLARSQPYRAPRSSGAPAPPVAAGALSARPRRDRGVRREKTGSGPHPGARVDGRPLAPSLAARRRACAICCAGGSWPRRQPNPAASRSLHRARIAPTLALGPPERHPRRRLARRERDRGRRPAVGSPTLRTPGYPPPRARPSLHHLTKRRRFWRVRGYATSPEIGEARHSALRPDGDPVIGRAPAWSQMASRSERSPRASPREGGAHACGRIERQEASSEVPI